MIWAPSPWRPAPGWSAPWSSGLTAAKALALALDIPLVAVDHLEGHLYACQLAYPDREVYPCVGPGGLRRPHQPLSSATARSIASSLGGTTDDAAGEAFDKVASLLGLGYPGGPEIERVARSGQSDGLRLPPVVSPRRAAASSVFRAEDGRALRLPRPECAGRRDRSRRAAEDRDLAASFQEAVVDVIVAKTRQALVRTGMKRLGVGGGVAANSRFRQRLSEHGRRARGRAFHPAALALHRQRRHGRGSHCPSSPPARLPTSTSTSSPDWSAPGPRALRGA